jgi:hypothetical protein
MEAIKNIPQDMPEEDMFVMNSGANAIVLDWSPINNAYVVFYAHFTNRIDRIIESTHRWRHFNNFDEAHFEYQRRVTNHKKMWRYDFNG